MLGFAGVGIALKALAGFPWEDTLATLINANYWILGLALVINLGSLVAKGWAWHLLLNPVSPNHWKTAQEANLVGAAVNNVSIAVGGEAARIHYIAQRDGVPVGAAISSVVWTRVTETIALAIFLVMAPSLLRLPHWLRGLQVGAGLGLVIVMLITWHRGWSWILNQLPASLQRRAAVLAEMGSGGRLFWPTVLGLANWGTQWATYHLVLVAAHIPVTPAASFTALVAANLGGIIRITPAGLGVTQAAMVVGLLQFGVPADRSVAAGLALQALQVLPVIFLGALLTGWRLTETARDAEETEALQPV
ncbi:MAG TPA: lysylphosphatidylglycerol synthase transmembrane domain-containing protein [Gemmatimonadales bacterium]|nr:lysylphosphatidylglycerol synthase transmembrane domain-containing protein [Gemmatimonadales bacterium]